MFGALKIGGSFWRRCYLEKPVYIEFENIWPVGAEILLAILWQQCVAITRGFVSALITMTVREQHAGSHTREPGGLQKNMQTHSVVR